MSALIGWALALAALVAGYVGYGWPGVLLAISVVVFWLLLQFSRALRALREAAGRPVGRVDNAVMLHARLRKGQRLVDVMKLTRSLGQAPIGHKTQDPEVFVWTDEAGDCVRVELIGGKVSAWSLQRAGAAPESPTPGGEP